MDGIWEGIIGEVVDRCGYLIWWKAWLVKSMVHGKSVRGFGAGYL